MKTKYKLINLAAAIIIIVAVWFTTGLFTDKVVATSIFFFVALFWVAALTPDKTKTKN
jgi:hypothetical protein